MTRVAAIGLDAAEWTFVEQLLAEGRLPHLAKIRERSAECRLRNMTNPERPWAELLTGRRESRSGVAFDARTYRTGAVAPDTSEAFYRLGPDPKAVVFDVPTGMVVEGAEGIQATAWGAHSPGHGRASRPEGLFSGIQDRFGGHPAFEQHYKGGWHQQAFLDRFVEALGVGANRRADIASWLLDMVPDWRLFLTVMSESHCAGEHLWHGVDPAHPLSGTERAGMARQRLIQVYEALDEAVGRLALRMPDDTVLVVMALHGMEANSSDVPSWVLIPELLNRLVLGRALLKDPDQEAWRQQGCPPVVPDTRFTALGDIRDHFADTRAEAVKRRVRLSLPGGPKAMAYALERKLTGKPTLRPLLDLEGDDRQQADREALDRMEADALDWQPPAWYRRSWHELPYFALPTFSCGQLRINLQGREADGIVPRDDYDRACDEAVEVLRRCRNARTGEPVLEEVRRARRDDVMAPDGPPADLELVFGEVTDALTHPDVGTVGPFPC